MLTNRGKTVIEYTMSGVMAAGAIGGVVYPVLFPAKPEVSVEIRKPSEPLEPGATPEQHEPLVIVTVRSDESGDSVDEQLNNRAGW